MSDAQGRFYPRVFTLVAVALLGVAVFKILEPFVGALLWAGLLAFLLFPANQALRRKLRGRKGGAALLLTLLVTLAIVIPTVLVLALFVAQGTDLANRLQAAVGRYHVAQIEDLFRLPLLEQTVGRITARLPVTTERAQDWVLQGGRRLLQALVSLSGALFAGALDTLLGVCFGMVLLFFLLRDGEEFVARLLSLIPLEEKRMMHLVAHLSAVTKAVVLGSLLTALVQGTLVGVGFALARLPFPIVFGVLGMGAALVPVVGTALLWAPAALVLAVQGRVGAALFLVLWGALVVSSADNFLRPLFISGRAQISTLPVFIGLVGGLSAFGAIGMFLGPVIVALVLALLEFAEEARGKSPVP